MASAPKSRTRRTRVLVTGATGMLGRQVLKRFVGEDWNVRGLCFSRSQPGLVSCDLSDADATRDQVMEFRPHVVLHCAAERRPDVVQKDPERAWALNVGSTRTLTEACHEIGAWLVFLSTDYVFDGTAPPYAVDAIPNPLNTYGKHKIEGEIAVQRSCKNVVLRVPPNPLNTYGKHKVEGEIAVQRSCKNVVLRVPLLYGPVEYLGESSVTDLYASVEKGMKKVDHRQKRYPTSAEDVAKILFAMVDAQRKGQRLEGTYHWQSNECFTKYDMVEVIGEVTGINIKGVMPDRVIPAAPRPEDSQLDCSRLEADLGIHPSSNVFRRPFVDAIRSALAPFRRTTPVTTKDGGDGQVPSQYSGKRRTAISAEAFGPWARRNSAPLAMKPLHQKRLDREHFSQILDAFIPWNVPKGSTIIQQGDCVSDTEPGLFVLEEGLLYAERNVADSSKATQVMQYGKPGDVFGELAVLHHAPRAASVNAVEDSVVWSVRAASVNAVEDSVVWSVSRSVVFEAKKNCREARRQFYDGVLKNMELLSPLGKEERAQVIDSLKSCFFAKGKEIMCQGDVGHDFFVLIKGEAVAIKDGVEVATYKPGGYFGELALLSLKPRAATVVAVTDCLCASMDQVSFTNLLGPLESLHRTPYDQKKILNSRFEDSSSPQRKVIYQMSTQTSDEEEFISPPLGDAWSVR
eukprot:CAMPEP_0115061630 /NCGR_PEP_ID=MMETSP0227-20121206/8108_1 /TAXON_ID=89957 /ORGANISM="Polarella glacialis, Strain CCMP 1383" /LENGTH=686 /DNA_ID=CAMNT_0002446941 /DNA_START=82 /DNA_END=2142 /DNA_ORIENTATION=+